MTSKTQFETIDEYIETFQANVQSILKKIRQIIQKTTPEAIETISYRIPSFNLNGRYLVYFARLEMPYLTISYTSGNKAFQKELFPYLSVKRLDGFCSINPSLMI
jgi:uncharacterized protein YdhG (YjbR/CyaY superfamily)